MKDSTKLALLNTARESPTSSFLMVMPEPRHANTTRALANDYSKLDDDYAEAMRMLDGLVAEGLFTKGKPEGIKDPNDLPGILYTLTQKGQDFEIDCTA